MFWKMQTCKLNDQIYGTSYLQMSRYFPQCFEAKSLLQLLTDFQMRKLYD